eukprot:g80.t1
MGPPSCGPLLWSAAFGAVGDSKHDDTQAIRLALKECDEVLLPAGKTFYTGPLNLTSNQVFVVDGTLLASADPADYPMVAPLISYGWSIDSNCFPYPIPEIVPGALNFQSIINSYNTSNVTVTGSGIIDGHGEPWWARCTKCHYKPPIGEWPNANSSCLEAGRPMLLQFTFVTGLNVFGTSNIRIKDLVILAPMNTIGNTDGIDISSSRDAIIENIVIKNSDDGICMNSGAWEFGMNLAIPTENVLVRNITCPAGGRGGFRVGIQPGGVRNITYRDSVLLGERGLSLLGAVGGGGFIHDVLFDNITNPHGISFSNYARTTDSEAAPNNRFVPKPPLNCINCVDPFCAAMANGSTCPNVTFTGGTQCGPKPPTPPKACPAKAHGGFVPWVREAHVSNVYGQIPRPFNRSSPGLPFLGLFGTADGCQSACEALSNCTQYSWSLDVPEFERHCYGSQSLERAPAPAPVPVMRYGCKRNATDQFGSVLRFPWPKLRNYFALSFLAAFAFYSAASEQQILWENKNKPTDPRCDSLKWLVLFTSCGMVGLVVQKYNLMLKEQKALGMITNDVQLWDCHLTRWMMWEMLFNLLCAPPYMHYEWAFLVGSKEHQVFAYYTLDVIMTIVISCRIYHNVPIFLHLFRKTSTASKMYAHEHQVNLGWLYNCKVILESRPLLFVGVVNFYLCAFFAYACWVFERGYCAYWVDQYFDAEITERCSLDRINRSGDIGDSYWHMMNMMTTLGNSTAPLTFFGRVVSTIGLVCGLSILALLLHATTEHMKFTPFEKRTYQTLLKHNHRIAGYAKAAQLIEAAWLRFAARGNAWLKVHNRREQKIAAAHFAKQQQRFRDHRKEGWQTVLLPTEHELTTLELSRAISLSGEKNQEAIEGVKTDLKMRVAKIEKKLDTRLMALEGLMSSRFELMSAALEEIMIRGDDDGGGNRDGRNAPTLRNTAQVARIVQQFYKEHNPKMVGAVPDILSKYKNQEDKLLKKLAKQYKTEIPAHILDAGAKGVGGDGAGGGGEAGSDGGEGGTEDGSSEEETY